MVEDELVGKLNSIWNVLFADPEVDIKRVIKERMDDLAARVNAALYEKFGRNP